MINKALISPKSIAVIGASSQASKPGGKVLINLIKGGFTGKVYGVNPNPLNIDGVEHISHIDNLPQVDLAILAIPANYWLELITKLLENNTKALFFWFWRSGGRR